MNAIHSSQSSTIPGDPNRRERMTISWNCGNSITSRMKPGVSRKASTQIIVCRSRMSDVTVSLAKKHEKKWRVRTVNGGGDDRTPGSLGVHGRDEAAGGLVDALFGNQRREHRVERRQLECGAQVADRIVAD